jgi:hypothetical protein
MPLVGILESWEQQSRRRRRRRRSISSAHSDLLALSVLLFWYCNNETMK